MRKTSNGKNAGYRGVRRLIARTHKQSTDLERNGEKMKIRRTGRNRNQTPAILVEKKLSLKKQYKSHKFWDKSADLISFRVSGKLRNSEYNYDITLTLDELLTCLQSGIEERCTTRAENALALASITTLSKLLSSEASGDA